MAASTRILLPPPAPTFGGTNDDQLLEMILEDLADLDEWLGKWLDTAR